MKQKLAVIFMVMLFCIGTFSYAMEVTDNKISVTIPYEDSNQDFLNDYELEVGTLKSYFVYNYLNPVSGEISGDKETFFFEIIDNNTYFYRVTNDYNKDAVTYGNYVKATIGSNYEVTQELMYVGSNEYNKDTVIDDISLNSYDVADILLNINEKGYLSLSKDDTYTIYPYRNWLAIENVTSNAKVIEPDFHYEIVEIEGEDVISIEECLENTSSKHSYKLTANSSGTAIVIITYDAMSSEVATGGNSFFSAIWPENAGVFVVTVDEENGLDVNLKINEGKNTTSTKLAGDNIDSEHDVLYYFGDEGAKYSFNIEEGMNVTVLRPIIKNNKINYTNGFVTEDVEIKDNVATVYNLVEGSNIVKIEKESKVEYQIIRTKKLDYDVTCTRSGEEIPLKELKPGDNVSIVFDTVYHPGNKFSGQYNNSAKISYNAENGEKIESKANQYKFASTKTAQTISIGIPQDWSGDIYTIKEGCVVTGGWGSAFGAHRETTYEIGKSPNFSAVQNISYLCRLPEIEFELTIAVSGDNESGDTASGDNESGDTVSGDNESGDTASGDNESGDTALGDNESGDTASGDNESGDTALGDNESGDISSENKPSTPGSNAKIKVYFRLIGATLSSNDVDLSIGEEGYYGSKYETWLKNKSYKLEKGSTAEDLITLALDNADILVKGVEDNYITMVKAPKANGDYELSAMTNGDYSGWMYTVNGEHPDYGISDMVLENNDKVILHYVNDYRYEIEGFYDDADGKFYNAWLNTTSKKALKTSSVKKQDEKEEILEVNDVDKIKLKVALMSTDTIFGRILKEAYNEKVEDMILDISNVMQDEISNPNVGSIGGEWLIFGLARANIDVDDSYYEKYYNNLVKYLKENDGILTERKYTEYSRVVLALTAIGKNPSNVEGSDLIAKLDEYDNVIKQGINGPIFALLALDSANYNTENTDIRNLYVEYILSKQLEDGGFSLNSNGNSDVDTTAMVIQALAKYKNNENVNFAINKALNYLSITQNNEGGFTNSNIENLESSAQVLVALNMAGIDIYDNRFIKNGNTILDNILKYYVENKGFKHTLDSEKVNQMATEQGLYSLVSLKRAIEGTNLLYDMNGEDIEFVIYDQTLIDKLYEYINQIIRR